MSKKKSYNQCISDNDWKTALDNYNNTTKRWKSYWFDCLKQLYAVCADFAKKYLLDPLNETITAIRRSRTSKYDSLIDSQNLNITESGKELCYLFEFYDNSNNLLCSKVGTTTRSVRRRIIEELTNKTYKNMGAVKAKVNRVYDCGSLPAEGLESLIRSEYIKQYPQSFKKNDRFIGELFDLNLCDTIANQYLPKFSNAG